MTSFWKRLIAFVFGFGLVCGSASLGLSTPFQPKNVNLSDVTAPAASSYFAKVRSDKPALRAFLRQMPKGGELHSHLSGTPGPDRLLELAAQSKLYSYFVRVPAQTFAPDDPKAYALVSLPAGAAAPQEANATFVPVAALLSVKTKAQAEQLAAFRRAQTISESEPNPNAVFFNATFARREAVTGNTEFVPQLVVDAMQQAQRDRVSYLELMLSPFTAYSEDSQTSRGVVTDLTRAQQYLTSLISTVEKFNQGLPSDQRVEVRFMLSFARTRAKLFSQLPVAFELAAGEDAVGNAIAGINLVGNEYSEDTQIGQEIARPAAVDDFILTLRRVYPTVRLSIHAGETTQWDWHIRDSILMGAERIGHGTNLANSPQPTSPEVKLMSRRKILIEACLTSNRLLLKVPLERHPFLNYLRAGIPVSLNTDDAGVFATDMTEEFARAVENHPSLTWAELKQLARASLEHAFFSDDTRQKLISRWEAEMGKFEASFQRGRSPS